ncbi:MAG: class I SAM-dependent methyltransferase [Candidatus Woesearchaeota archaeon]
MKTKLKKLVIDEFSGKDVQELYIQKAEDGLWKSEEKLIDRYFKKRGKVLDIGCGTGRTTIALVKKRYKVIGIDIVPKMIENAKKIAKKKKLKIHYRVMDACNLNFKDKTFYYALFSNQGWTQIPGKENRFLALKETYRVLKKEGVYIFSAHIRQYSLKWLPLWSWMWFKLYILKSLGFKIDELDFGDRFFGREMSGAKFKTKQYIHVGSVKEASRQLNDSGFQILSIGKGVSEQSGTKPTFFVCRKRG